MDSRHPDIRGSYRDRRRRRRWLLSTFGDGKTVRCYWCPVVLTNGTMTVDRYPVCGHDGGRYTHDNIVPSCYDCNRSRCDACDIPRGY